jgi:hypothetical protein
LKKLRKPSCNIFSYQEIVNKIALAELDVTPLNAAVSCEKDKTRQIALYQDSKESEVLYRRIIAGLFTAASASLVSGAIVLWATNGNTSRELLGVGACLATITLNLITKTKVFKVPVAFEVKPLRSIYDLEADRSNHIRPAVWYYI